MAALRKQEITKNTKSGGLSNVTLHPIKNKTQNFQKENLFMANYFRITAHYAEKNVSFIADSNGKFEKLWQFSAYLVAKGCKINAVSNIDDCIPCEIKPIPFNAEQFVIRTCYMGTPTETHQSIDGVSYKAIRVKDMLYVPNKDEE